MPTFQFLPSIRDSETTTCWHCNTCQYPNGTCIRCHKTLDVEYACLRIGNSLDQRVDDQPLQLARWIGNLLRNLRTRRGIRQSQLAEMGSGIDRSYLSKAERGLALLPLSKLLPLLHSLGLTAVIMKFEARSPRTSLKSSYRR